MHYVYSFIVSAPKSRKSGNMGGAGSTPEYEFGGSWFHPWLLEKLHY